MELKVIWITGASSGIGKEMALQYAKRSSTALILSSRREEVLNKVKSACGGKTPICVLPMDLEATNEAAAVVEKALACFGHIDLLINNGGVSQRSLIVETEITVFERLIQINYLGFPGTTCLPNMDFLIADKFVIPKKNMKFYSEKIIYMPNCFINSIKYQFSKSKKESIKFYLPPKSILLAAIHM